MHVEFYRHALTEDDIQAAAQVLRSVFLTTGPAAAEFERLFSSYTGLEATVSLNSCTGAMHLALLALGVGPGDEVIVPAMTFIATATVVAHCGATPVLVDVEPESGLIDPQKIEAAITSRTKGIIPVHLYGTMADMRALRDIADRHKLFILEDCAHCVEGERDGVRPGQLSDAACYSFYATKNLACGEGGALASKHPGLAAKVRLLRQHGMNKEAADRYTGTYKHWDMVALGWKYNLSDILASLLVGQIPRLEKQLECRKAIAEKYDDYFAGNKNIHIPERVGKSACHLYTVLVPDSQRDKCLAGMQDKNIGVAVNYRAIHTLQWFRENFRYRPESFPVAHDIGNRTISLPFHLYLKDEEIAYVSSTLTDLLK